MWTVLAVRFCRNLILGMVLSAVVMTGCAPVGTEGAQAEAGSANEVPEVRRGDWLGEQPPTTRARLFAPGVVSTGLYERDLALHPDGNEIYWSVVLGSFDSAAVLRARRGRDGVWSEPEVAPFSGRYRDLEPMFDPSGERLYFVSNRPLPGNSEAQDHSDIWYVERAGDDWGEPQRLPGPVNSDAPEFFPSFTRDGTLYLTRDEPDGRSRIYRAARDGDGWAEPEPLGATINGHRTQFNGLIDPDERFLIFSAFGREDSLGGVDYYVAPRNADGSFGEAVNLGPAVNSKSRDEYAPGLSPDGKYLFFMSSRSRYQALPGEARTREDLLQSDQQPENGRPDVYWIPVSAVPALENF